MTNALFFKRAGTAALVQNFDQQGMTVAKSIAVIELNYLAAFLPWRFNQKTLHEPEHLPKAANPLHPPYDKING